MAVTNCLTREELSEYIRGRVDASRVDAIAGHVECCAGCQETVVLLAEKSDTFVNALRGSNGGDPFVDEPACRDALLHLTREVAISAPPRGDIDRIGPYQIVERLGSGGMGTVFKALHTKLKRTVALKILPASRWASAAAVTRFEREMQAIGQLDHPHIVRASDAGEEFGMHYLVMEYVDGLDLSRVVRRLGTLPIAEVCEIGRQAALGLQYADENRLVHRDIKPSNLILTGKRTADHATLNGHVKSAAVVKILDLGLALLGDEHAEQRDNLTTVGQLMGTLDYMSPEQGHDCHDVDIRADIYSLGATLFKLLTGRAPFAGPEHNTLLKKLSALANKPVPRIQSLRPEISNALAAVIDRLLAHDPVNRFSSPAEVAAALAPFARDADLTGLLERARLAPEPESDSAPQIAPAARLVVGPSPSILQSRRARSSMRWMIWIGLLASVLLIIFAGFVIRLVTDRGELVVEAVDPNVNVVIKQNNQVVQQLELEKGENRVTVRSGQYQIELGSRGDELVLSNNALSIQRGQRTIVRITEKPRAEGGFMFGTGAGSADMSSMMGTGMESSGGGGMATMPGMMSMGSAAMNSAAESGAEEGMIGGSAGGMSGAASGFGSSGGMMPAAGGMMMGYGGVGQPPQPTFNGKTYGQWLSELETERNPERLTEAVRAFADLGEDELANKSAASILQIMRRYGSNVIDTSVRGQLVQETFNALRQLPGDVVAEAVVEELRNGNTRSRNFLLNQFLLYSQSFQNSSQESPETVTTSELQQALKRRMEEFVSALMTIAATTDEAPEVRAGALGLLLSISESQSLDPHSIEDLTEQLRAAVGERNTVLVEVASRGLVQLDPEHAELVPALIRQLASKGINEYYRHSAIVRLGTLGERAAPAIPVLLKIIEPWSKDATGVAPAPGTPAMYGGGGFGTMMGSGGGYSGHDIPGAAISALSQMGSAAKPALPMLQRIAALQLHVYSQLAAEAIAQIEEQPANP